MALLKIISTADSEFPRVWGQLHELLSLEKTLLGDRGKLEKVRGILEKVRNDGDQAVSELTAAFDKVTLKPEEFRISRQELKRAHERMDERLLRAVRESIGNVRRYQKAVRVKVPVDWTERGGRLGVRYHPLRRVGVCVPGASAPLVSTVIMTVVPAQAAGVKEIAVVSAPRHNGSIHPDILGVCQELGVEEVYRVSGAQAVAALAYGTTQIPRVDKIVGPSSDWAQLAKKELFGIVDIDSFAGPSDVLILADESARADWVAADLLSQAEHAPGSAVLITDSPKLGGEVVQEVEKQLSALSRCEQTRGCVQRSCLAVVTRDLAEAVKLANEFAPEHLQVQCKDSDAIAEEITNAGAIFVGPYTPVAVGDYYAGPSHTLPTGGTARLFGPLNVNDFLKASSVVCYTPEALARAAEAIDTIAGAEGLDAHARSVRIRTAIE